MAVPWARIAKGAAGAVGGLALLVFAGRAALAVPRPDGGVAGPEAEAMAARAEEAVGVEAWAATGVVEWSLFGDTFLWDRERNLVRVEDRRGVVLTEGWRPMGRAFKDGAEVGGDWKDRRVASAYERFVNAAFWAFAPFKLRDEGALRQIAHTKDGEVLFVSYPSGGVTPGDAYAWELDGDGRPAAYRIWASVLPLPGARFVWGDWQELDTGAWVATSRRAGPVTFRVTGLRGAAHLQDWTTEDPFGPMFR